MGHPAHARIRKEAGRERGRRPSDPGLRCRSDKPVFTGKKMPWQCFFFLLCRFPCDLPGGGGSRYPVRRGKGEIIRISRMWKADALLDVMPGRSREKPKAASPKGRQALPRRKNPANRGHLQFFVLDWQDPILIKFHTCILCIRYTLSGLRALRPRHRSPVRATFRRCWDSERSLVSIGATAVALGVQE